MSAFGYKRTLLGTVIYFRFTPNSGHWVADRHKRATSDLGECKKVSDSKNFGGIVQRLNSGRGTLRRQPRGEGVCPIDFPPPWCSVQNSPPSR